MRVLRNQFEPGEKTIGSHFKLQRASRCVIKVKIEAYGGFTLFSFMYKHRYMCKNKINERFLCPILVRGLKVAKSLTMHDQASHILLGPVHAYPDIFESATGKKKLRTRKYPNTCGRGLRICVTLDHCSMFCHENIRIRVDARPRPHVSGYCRIRNFFFPNTATVHTYPANSAANPEINKSALQSGKEYIRNKSDNVWTGESGYFFYPMT